ncbi:MAG: hypothetical protein E7403_02700 [Ruminococcaceae bacterium]|nr:hypothetical protein [Oscillospiraceae bacterium]
METLLISSKGNNKYRTVFLILGIICIIGSIIFFMTNVGAKTYYSRSQESLKMVGILITALLFCFGLLAFLFAFVRCNGYINVYEDHAEGKGLQGKGMNTFYLSNNQIRSVTQESYYLCLHTDIGVFRIICDKKSRLEIMKFYAKNSF